MLIPDLILPFVEEFRFDVITFEISAKMLIISNVEQRPSRRVG